MMTSSQFFDWQFLMMTAGLYLLFLVTFLTPVATADKVQWCPLAPGYGGGSNDWWAGCCYMQEVQQGCYYVYPILGMKENGARTDSYCYLRSSFVECVPISSTFKQFIFYYCSGTALYFFTVATANLGPDRRSVISYRGATAKPSLPITVDHFMILTDPVSATRECYFYTKLTLYKVYRIADTNPPQYGYSNDGSGRACTPFDLAQTRQMSAECNIPIETFEPPPPIYTQRGLTEVKLGGQMLLDQFTRKLDNTIQNSKKQLVPFHLDLERSYRNIALGYFQTSKKPKGTVPYVKESFLLPNPSYYVSNPQALLDQLVPTDDFYEIIHQVLYARDKSFWNGTVKRAKPLNYKDSAMFNCVLYYRIVSSPDPRTSMGKFYLVCLFYFRSFLETLVTWSDEKHYLSFSGAFDDRRDHRNARRGDGGSRRDG